MEECVEKLKLQQKKNAWKSEEPERRCEVRDTLKLEVCLASGVSICGHSICGQQF